MRGLLLLVLLSGCFFRAGVSYAPSTKIDVTRPNDSTAMSHTEPTASFTFRLGFHMDLFGVGAHYAWYGARAIRAAGGVPANINGHGPAIQVDVDTPLALAGGLIRVRASYAWDRFDEVNLGNDGEPPSTLGASGVGHHGGVTLAGLNKDVQLSVLVGKFSFESERDMVVGWPQFSISGWDVDVGLTINFIPTGLMTHYVAGKYERQRVCGMWSGGGNTMPQFGCN